MVELNIPTEVKDVKAFPQVDKTARQIIAYAVLMGADNQTAFMRFHPEFIDASGKAMNSAGKQASRQFWGYGKVKDYREVYETELAEFFGQKQKPHNVDSEIDDTKIESALKKLLSHAIGLLDRGSNLDPDSVKTIVEVFKKMNLLKDDVEQEIRPIRVLPARCSECRYKAFVESSVLEGATIDCCAYCKARKFAEEHGCRFNDGKDLLEIPEEVIRELDEKNDVKLTDILAGKVEN